MLGRGRETGLATIVALNVVTADYLHKTLEYVADVEPASGAPMFRSTFEERFAKGEFHEPQVGERAAVTFRANQRDVEFDRDALRAQLKESENARRADFEAVANAAPGTPAPAAAGGATPGSAALGGSLEILEAIMQAKAAGDDAEVERLKGEMQRLKAQNG